MKTYLFIALIFVAIFFSSCAGYQNAMTSGSKVKKLELGMTKSEVTRIMGNTYRAIAAANEDGRRIEVIGYETEDSYWMYILYFSDGMLDRYQREWTGNPYPVPPPAEN